MGQFQKHAQRRFTIPMSMSDSSSMYNNKHNDTGKYFGSYYIHDNSTGRFLSGRCTFDLLVFQYHVENGSDGWVFNNSSYPTKEI